MMAATFPNFVPPPIPDGWTEAQVRTVMQSFALDGNAPGHLDGYVDDSFYRFLHTWGLVRSEQGRVLELGANPYFMTFLLREATALEPTLANFFGEERGRAVQRFRRRDRDGIETSEKIESDLFNLEVDRFPYDDDAFDVVLFCEIIEHLVDDPLHAMREIHRVLRPGGLLVVTTPNVARLANVLALVAGGNIYDPYSGFGPYGRHNREYTQHELVLLLRFCGFTMERHFTADGHVADHTVWEGHDTVAPALEFRKNDVGQYVFVACRATTPPLEGRPEFLYRSYPPEEIIAGWH